MFKKTFDTVAEGYDNNALRFFSESAKHFADYLNLTGNENILDVATGTGNSAFSLAKHLPKGKVTGIDFSKGMLANAKAKMDSMNLSNIDFLEMDMQNLKFPDNHFDTAICSFGIFFVEDMVSQLSKISMKIKSGGNIIISTFSEDLFLPLVELFLDRLKKYKVEIPPLSWMRIASRDKCVSLFQNAGLKDVRIDQKDFGYYLFDASQWWEVIWNAGFRGLVSQLSAKEMEEFKSDHLKEIQNLSTSDGIWLNVKVLYALGVKE